MSVPAAASERPRLIGVFESAERADRAYQTCLERGYDIGEVNVVLSEVTRRKLLESRDESKAELAARKAAGGELGGPHGGRVGLLVTVGAAIAAAVAVPVIGFAAGPIAVALTAAGTAGVAGGLIAVFGDWGVPEDSIRRYQEDIRSGAILLSLEANSAADASAIADEWRAIGGRDIRRH